MTQRTQQLPQEPAFNAKMATAIGWLAENYRDQPTLAAAAENVGLSPHHFQRQFVRHVGVSPKKYIQYLTLSHVKERLADADSVLDAAYDAGPSGPGRLHDLFVTHEAMTPGEWKARAAHMALRYGWHDSPFGECLIVVTDRGICGLAFRDGDRADNLANLAAGFDRAQLVADAAATKPYADQIFGPAKGQLNLVLRGTPFQLKVWDALLRIPQGAVVSYRDLARRVCTTDATRAVAGAVARNQISWLIPCHRVVRNNGTISGYRWHPDRKRAMLAWEAARTEEIAA